LAFENSTNVIFSVLIVGVLLFGLYDIFVKRGELHALCSSVVVNLGMLGTFVGIVAGLIDFDTGNIDKSIPPLLDGLKTAFITSIEGMIAFIILKFAYNIRRTKDDKVKGDTEAEKMIGLLEKIADNGDKNTALLEEMKKSISGDGETTLITQIQKLRTTTTDNLQELNKSFKEFADKQTENNTNALTEAINNLTHEFNKNLTEQFGDNFKQLNEAVGKLLVWQENYKEYIETTTKQLLDSIEICEKTLEKMTNDEASFQATADSLDDLLKILNTDLVGIKEVGEKAKDVLPQIQKNIDAMTENFKNHIIKASKENEEVFDGYVEVIANKLEAIDKTNKNFEAEMKKACERIENTTRINCEVLTNTTKANEDGLRKITTETSQQINHLMQENASKITNQIENTDKALSEELSRAINTMGNGLASISNKFLEDYRAIGDTVVALRNELNRIRANHQ